MSNKIKWIRPSGNAIETADTEEIIEYAVSNGWELADKPKQKPKKVAKNDNSNSGDRGRS